MKEVAMAQKNYIGGRWAATKAVFSSINPADTDDVLGEFPASTAREADQAVQAARNAFPEWRKRSRIQRSEFIDAFAQLAKARTADLARLLARESGKCLSEARADILEGIHMAQFTAGRARMPYGEVIASEIPEKDAFMLRKPKGVVAAISQWNFPFAIPLWLILPSLLEGNTVVFKPASDTPLMGQKIVELFEEASLPPGVLNLVQGHGGEAGWPLVEHPDVDVILFTGSSEVGSKIKQAIAGDFRKFAVCEMGGKNAIAVFEDADVQLAASAAVTSAFRTSGQRCSAASRLLVHERLLKPFTQAFLEMTSHMRIGDPQDEKTFMGPVINEGAVKKVLGYNALAKREGAKVLLDGRRMSGRGYDRGFFLSPFVYQMRHTETSRCLREEVFGPHVAIIPFKSLDEAIAIYNDTDYGFILSVITNNYRITREMRERCDFGVGYVNLPTIGAEVHLPFGGLKKSGTGLPSASTLIDAVTHRVAWTVNHAREIKLAQGLSAKVD
jgi:aldehyde dehydrogenase (NAD+)